MSTCRLRPSRSPTSSSSTAFAASTARSSAASRLPIGRGLSYGLVGESGCGKSTAALAIVRYLPRNGRVTGGSISVAGRNVLALGQRGSVDYHARTVSMVYQSPGPR